MYSGRFKKVEPHEIEELYENIEKETNAIKIGRALFFAVHVYKYYWTTIENFIDAFLGRLDELEKELNNG